MTSAEREVFKRFYESSKKTFRNIVDSDITFTFKIIVCLFISVDCTFPGFYFSFMFVSTSRPIRSRLCMFVCLPCIHVALRAKLMPHSVPLKAVLKHWRTHWLSNDHWSARASARGLAHPHYSDIDWTLGSLFSLRPAGSMSKSITAASTPHSDKKREMEFLVFLFLLSSSLAFLLDPPPLLCQRVRVTPGRRSSSSAVADDISIEFPFGQSARPSSVPGPTHFL